MQQKLKIEIFSDVVCPWCFIGKRRLDRTLAAFDPATVELRWRPYQLYPQLPPEGIDRETLLRRRYGENADRARVPQRIDEEARGEAIELRFDLMERTPNTLLAHRLLEHAYDSGLQHELAESLFLAYFCEGVDVGDADALVAIAERTGLDAEQARAYLASDAGEAEVRRQLARAPELGISGVPGYYLADSFLLPGAQTSETMGQILERVQTRLVEMQA